MRAVHVRCEALQGELRMTRPLRRLQVRGRLHVLVLICLLLRILRRHRIGVGWIGPPSSRPIGEPSAELGLVWSHSPSKPLSGAVSDTLTWASLGLPSAAVSAATPSSETPVAHFESIIIVRLHKI
jgi:hypothetical protein